MLKKLRLSKAAEQLRSEINAKYPKRDKRSDGWIGDLSHSARKSDHNPDKNGWVRAIDIDSDLVKGSFKESWLLAENIKMIALKGDKRISYIIHQHRIASPRQNWAWRVYKGSNPHVSHLHISFTKAGDLNGKAFGI
jgi:hypothetical protein